MTQIVPLDYCPDLDTAWMVRPGAVSSMNGFAPTNRNSYGTVGSGYFIGGSGSIIGNDVLHAQMFRQTSGAVRLLVFRKQNIDEYDSSATRTNQGTSYSASTADWNAAAYGNAIIATNYLDVVQVSTGTTFGTLAGSPPKARLVAVNSEFVMLADTNDGTAYPDGWACSGIGNYQTWAANASTQAANGRILSEPGPIRALVAYREGFVVFKDNSMFQMDYIGPPFVWSVKRISNRVGCPSAHGVVELAGKLYFYHSSGIWQWDGANLTSVGDKIINTFNNYVGYTGLLSDPDGLGVLTYAGPSKIQAVADDIENVVAFCGTATSASNIYQWTYALNTLTGKWGRWTCDSGGAGSQYRYIVCTTADSFSFVNSRSNRLLAIQGGATNSNCRAYSYPATIPASFNSNETPRMSFGVVGDYSVAAKMNSVRLRDFNDPSIYNLTFSATAFEGSLVTSSSGSGVYNSTLGQFDNLGHGKLHYVAFTVDASSMGDLAGAAIEMMPSGKR
jgi:hypothetical protein